jgi:E3 ubiquitin-protein ligase BRE1
MQGPVANLDSNHYGPLSLSKPSAGELANRLETDLQIERTKCASLSEEVESLYVMFGDLETENRRLVNLLAEKESVLSRVMSEKLRGRQQLATVKEEARSLAQGRELDQDKIKNLISQVAASRRESTEGVIAAKLAMEEARSFSQQLSQQRKIADESTTSARAAEVGADAMRMERDIAVAQCEQLRISGQTDGFAVKRITEAMDVMKLKFAEERAQWRQISNAAENGGDRTGRGSNDDGAGEGKDSLRDEIIQELMKKLHCSVVPNQPKEVTLIRCGHMLSRQCVSQLVSQRSRKCPLCGKGFSESDILPIFLD